MLETIGSNSGLEDVANHLNISVRTLRRRLRDEGTSFRELQHQLRTQVATKFLRDTEMTIDDIAHVVGFSETANFRHAFKRWMHKSPRTYRQEMNQSSGRTTGRPGKAPSGAS